MVWSHQALTVLPPSQQALKPLLEEFSKTHYLVGGTAISLQLGHRQSIDFDLFSFGPQGSGKQLMQRITSTHLHIDPHTSTIHRQSDEEQSEAVCSINGVKIQLIDFSRNPFDVQLQIPQATILESTIKSFDLLTLAGMKCYAMMYRSKRKDAVDLYQIINNTEYRFSQCVQAAITMFQSLYQPKATLENIIANQRDMTEKVQRISPAIEEKHIQNFLIDTAHTYYQTFDT